MVPVILDVTGDVSIQNAVERVQEETGADGLWALINNAGVAVGGPVEEGVQPIGDAKLTLFFSARSKSYAMPCHSCDKESEAFSSPHRGEPPVP
jgi:NAD(P)-dependent dehydrogenase (short-subunit alcohol dehydrogenase family)